MPGAFPSDQSKRELHGVYVIPNTRACLCSLLLQLPTSLDPPDPASPSVGNKEDMVKGERLRERRGLKDEGPEAWMWISAD